MNRFNGKKGAVVVLIIMAVTASMSGCTFIENMRDDTGNTNYEGGIKNGVQVIFVPKDLGRVPTDAELESARTIMRLRLERKNFIVIDKNSGSIRVKVARKSCETDSELENTMRRLGDMGNLTFEDPDGKIVLTGKHFVSAKAVSDQSNPGQYAVELKFNSEGQLLFSEATGRLVGKTISIYMDDIMVSNPRVESKIDSETCIINKIATHAEAYALANQISCGSLPFAMTAESITDF